MNFILINLFLIIFYFYLIDFLKYIYIQIITDGVTNGLLRVEKELLQIPLPQFNHPLINGLFDGYYGWAKNLKNWLNWENKKKLTEKTKSRKKI